MPIHDWTRVPAGVFHDFRLGWIVRISQVLNGGLLPESYYAMVERVAGPEHDPLVHDSGIAVAEVPPRVAVCEMATEAAVLARRCSRLAIRHATGDQTMALLEIVTPGNKEKRGAMEQFVDKAVGAMDEGFHLLVIDLLPPGPADPRGIHGAIWGRLGGSYDPPAGKPLTLAAYAAGQGAGGTITCYVEPTSVGTGLIEMPLFFDPGHYVNVPLEPTYLAAYEGVPKRWRRLIEGEG